MKNNCDFADAPVCPKNRGKAWRRAQAFKTIKKQANKTHKKWRGPYIDKKWSQMYLRHNKLQRAKQLAMIWPPKEWKKVLIEIEHAE